MISVGRAAALSVCSGVIVLIGVYGKSEGRIHPATTDRRTPIMEGLSIDAYDTWQRSMVIQADRAYASTKRLGFLQTGLVPTLELHDVVITQFHPDGTTSHTHAPSAVIDWSNKHLISVSGTPRSLDE